MARCFMCDQQKPDRKMRSERVADKRVCNWCYVSLGGPGVTKEMEVFLMIRSDMRQKADPSRSQGGRFKRHKG